MDHNALEMRVTRATQRLAGLREEIHKVVIGQDPLIDRLLVALVSGGHVLLEGVPGLAKTLVVKTLADCIGLDFQRISFTPDLLPADIVGTMIYHPGDGVFRPKQGPVFANLLLADEINRAPAKVQSALLEAMQERQVTLGQEVLPLPDPFMTLATQNPLEQEGTYPLPEAQTDRFMLKCLVNYPSRDEERMIMNRFARKHAARVDPVLTPNALAELRTTLERIYCDDRVAEYMLDLVAATRDPSSFGIDADPLIACGASPRATLYLHQSARASAMLNGRAYVTPQDVKDYAHDVLRHRIILSYEADASNITTETLITRILDTVRVP